MIIFKIKQKGIWQDKSQYVQIPVSIVQTLDETMDRGEITLNFTPDENEYEPYDFAYLEIDGKEYYMMIESDEVEELVEGISSFYKHNLTLVEATQYLSTLDLNDFSITQSLEYYTDTQYSIVNKINDMVWSSTFKDNDNSPADWRISGTAFTYKRVEGLGERVNYGGIFKLNFDIKNNVISKVYNKDFNSNDWDFYLPIPDVSATFYGRTEFKLFGVRLANLEEQFDLAYTETLINITTGQSYSVSSVLENPNQTTNRRVILSNLPAGSYVYKISALTQFWNKASNASKLVQLASGDDNWTTVFSSYSYASQGGLSGANRLVDYEYPFEVVNSGADNKYNVTVADALKKALANTVIRKLEDGRYWRTISLEDYNALPFAATLAPVFQSFPEPNVAFGSARAYEYTTRAQIILSGGGNVYYRVDSQLVSPIAGSPIDTSIYDNSFSSNVFYTKNLDFRYDENILNRAAAITSVDFTFAGGKNLLEVLFEIGKAFGGLPRVIFDDNLNPVISFDILEEIVGNLDFEDEFTTMRKTASTSSYATNLVTELKNAVVSDDIGLKSANTVVYPSKNSFVTPRAQSYNSALMRPDTMTIAVDDGNHGIYDVVKVEVRNFNTLNQVADITEYVHEKTVYDSFPNSLPAAGDTSKAHKGIALYFNRGDNFIENIGQIPTPDNIFGQEGTKYTIERILEKAGFTLSNKSKLTYQFRIEYVPIIKAGRLTVEQSNVTLENNKVSMPFNQTERNTSIPQFFQAADNALKRNGIPSILKNYIFNDVSQIPSLGQRIDFEGYDYFVDKISISYNTNIVCEVQYSREVNKVDPLVGFNKEYRSYQLAQDNVVWKRLSLNNYFYITENNDFPSTTFSLVKNIFPKAVANSLNNSLFSSEVEKLGAAVFNFYDLNARKIKFNTTNKTAPVGMTLIGSPAGNSLIFTASMYDNFSAGRSVERLTWTQENETAVTAAGDAIGNLIEKDPDNNTLEKNRVKQNFIRYVDDEGEAQIANVLFLKDSNTAVFNPLTVPELSNGAIDYKNLVTNAVLNEVIHIDKDNREGIQFTFQLHAISKDKNIEIKPALMKYNKLVSDISKYPVQPGNLALVGVNDVAKIKTQRIYDYDPSDVIVSQAIVAYGTGGLNANQVGLIGTTQINNKQKTYQGVALVYSNTKEIVLVKKKTLSPGALIGPVYMSFSEEAL